MGISGKKVPLQFTFSSGVAKWSGITQTKNDCTRCNNPYIQGLEILSGCGDTPSEALLDLADTFQRIADAARAAAENPKIKYDTMHIEPNPQLPPGRATAQTEANSPPMKQIGSGGVIVPENRRWD